MSKEVEIIVNDHFEDFVFNWDYKNYFLFGGYGSSKSYHVAEKIILKLLEEKRKCLIVREVFDTHRDSTYSLLMEICENIGINTDKCFKSSPLSVKFPNGSTIIFKGMDKPAKLKSINGVSIIWLEECSEVKYNGYKELLGRLRHMKLSNHIICSTNPVSTDNWTYSHFFKDDERGHFVLDDEKLYKDRIVVTNNTYYHHSTCEDNKFLPKDYIEELDKMKSYDLDLYRVARLGRYGVNGTKVFPQIEIMEHQEVVKLIENIEKPLFKTGMDFGFEISYNAISRMAIDHKEQILYIFEEYYTRGKTDPQIAEDIKAYKERKELIKADCAEPKAIKYYRDLGFNMRGCKKFKGSRSVYTKKVKRFKKIIISTNCPNHKKELQNLTFKINSKGEIIEDEFNIDPHTLSAIWYGLDDYEVTNLKGNISIFK